MLPTPQRSAPPARPASWATLAAHVSHFPGTPLALPPRARPPPPCPPPRLCAACVPGKSLLGASAGRTVFPLSPPSLSDRLFSDAGLARTRTALLLPRWGFHVTCWEASLSSPLRHSADLLFSVLRHSPSEGSFPLPGRPSLAASRAFWAPRLPRPSEGGHRPDFKASLPHVSLRFPRGPFIHFISVFYFEGFSC